MLATMGLSEGMLGRLRLEMDDTSPELYRSNVKQLRPLPCKNTRR